MKKDEFLTNLKKFLHIAVCDRLYADASTSSKQTLEQEVDAFIHENSLQYSLEELTETFSSADSTIGLFMEYREARYLTSMADAQAQRTPEVQIGDLRKKKVPTARECSKDWWEPITGMLFVWVPGGRFFMGCDDEESLSDEHPVHEVCLDGFWIGKFAVTVAQYMKFVKATDSHYPQWLEKDGKYNIIDGEDDTYKKLGKALIGQTYPIVGVAWHDAMAFSQWLSENSPDTFTLPTEAEWEYAARSGGKPEKYSGGTAIDTVAWYHENSGGTPHPVGTKTPNGLGIHNMSGNVSEWCLDVYSRFAYEKHPYHNPVNLTDGTCRVVRGGSWNYGARDVRCTDRSIFVADVRSNDLGFRLVRK